jgi:hypothetical protein
LRTAGRRSECATIRIGTTGNLSAVDFFGATEKAGFSAHVGQAVPDGIRIAGEKTIEGSGAPDSGTSAQPKKPDSRPCRSG